MLDLLWVESPSDEPIRVKQVNQIDLQYLEIINVPSFHNDLIIDFLNKNCKVNINELFLVSLSI